MRSRPSFLRLKNPWHRTCSMIRIQSMLAVATVAAVAAAAADYIIIIIIPMLSTSLVLKRHQ